MLYKKNTENFSEALFQSPTSEYRGTPFWAWNGDLNEDELRRQIGWLQEMGFGGFHMHCRSGLVTPYLSEDFFGMIKSCIDEAKKKNMLAWLYDEDRWPSGAAGGIVTRDKTKRARHLLFTVKPRDYSDVIPEGRAAESHLLRCYDIMLNEDGTLAGHSIIGKDDEAKGTKWYAYLELSEESSWYNNQTYVDTLDEGCIAKFVETTHDAYYREVGEDFGGIVPAIFSDEPQFTKKDSLGFAFGTKDIILPWTDDLHETFAAAYSEDLFEKLPELLWDLPEGRVSVARYHFHAHISERFAAAFSDQIGGWCEKHGLNMTGHMLSEPTLESQTGSLGEVMRSLASFQLPGIDMLCDAREYTTAKQAQSVAHQYGREGVMSELYGVTNWDFDFRDHKLAGDWQAALGVTVRVPHLSWVTMLGEAKRDYPASIHYQAPWFREYPLLENHYARVNTAMTRGKPDIRVGVIHPVESYWLHWGPQEQTAAIRKHLDSGFENITDWLLFGQIDFNYISEALLPSQCEKGSAPLQVGAMAYDVILVPNCETLRSTTVARLKAFVKAGGKLIFTGCVPTMVDAVPSDEVLELSKSAKLINFSEYDILSALEAERQVEIVDHNSARTHNLLTQLRQDGDTKWLFVAHGRRHTVEAGFGHIHKAKDILPQENITIRLTGEYSVSLYDTITGEVTPLKCAYRNGKTEISHTFYAHDSLLLRLEPGKQAAETGVSFEKEFVPYRFGHVTINKKDADSPFFNKVPVTLSEPNVLMLDMAEWKLDDGEWQPREEVLRLHRIARSILGFPNDATQPWAMEMKPNVNKLTMRFTIESEIELTDAKLALEFSHLTTVRLNGEDVPMNVDGWYVDERIHTVKLPVIHKGTNTLEMTVAFGLRTNTENAFLLGDFGVRVQGTNAWITEPVRELTFSDITRQGLPFYGGNVEYHLNVTAGENGLTVRAPHYRGALVGVSLDGKRVGSIVFAPYTLKIDCEPGEHELVLTCFGNRLNTFGTPHNANSLWHWYGPTAWDVYGDEYSYEYQIKPTGILKSPEVIK